jgi:hypothetical protein
MPTISKVYEMVLSDQLTDLFENIFHTFLCTFRKGHGCQTTLLRLLEDLIKNLNNKGPSIDP